MTTTNPLPPHNLEAEMAVLGSLIIDPDAILDVQPILGSDSTAFYKVDHQWVYDAILDYHSKGMAWDLIAIEAHPKCQALSRSYIIQLINAVPTSINAASYAHIVAQCHTRRKYIVASSKIATDAYNENLPLSEVEGNARQNILSVGEGAARGGVQKPVDYASEYLTKLQARIEAGEEMVGLSTGLKDLDKKTMGMEKGTLIIVGGAGGMGKSSFVVGIAAHNALDMGKRVAIFSLEMTTDHIMRRIEAKRARIPLNRLRRGNLTHEEEVRVIQVVGEVGQSKLFIDPTSGLSANDIRMRCESLYALYGLDLIVIDHLGLMGGKGNEKEKQDRNAIGCASLAKHFNVPVLLLQQLNKESRRGQNKRPTLLSLMGSDTSPHARAVWFIHREGYYDDGLSEVSDNIAEIIVAKSNEGETGKVDVAWIGERAAFDNLAYIDLNEYSPNGAYTNGHKAVTNGAY